MSRELEQLQTSMAFQEQALEEFNTVLTSQQQQIDRLQLEIRLLKEKLSELEDRLASAQPGATQHEVPPHY